MPQPAQLDQKAEGDHRLPNIYIMSNLRKCGLEAWFPCGQLVPSLSLLHCWRPWPPSLSWAVLLHAGSRRAPGWHCKSWCHHWEERLMVWDRDSAQGSFQQHPGHEWALGQNPRPIPGRVQEAGAVEDVPAHGRDWIRWPLKAPFPPKLVCGSCLTIQLSTLSNWVLLSWQGQKRRPEQPAKGSQKSHGAMTLQLCRLLSRRERKESKEEIAQLLQSSQEQPAHPSTHRQCHLHLPLTACSCH